MTFTPAFLHGDIVTDCDFDLLYVVLDFSFNWMKFVIRPMYSGDPENGHLNTGYIQKLDVLKVSSYHSKTGQIYLVFECHFKTILREPTYF